MTKSNNKKKKNYYFTEVHEKAIIQYAKSTDFREKTKLYEDLIMPAFNEMVDKIVYTYKFVTLPNIDDLKDECKIQLVTILDKYDENKGYKAFSYFSVVTKNWFSQQAKKRKKRALREVDAEEKIKEAYYDELVVHNPYETTREDQEFWLELLEEIDYWKTIPLKEAELDVLYAIEHLMRNIDQIEIFNKKAIYLYMRELTGMNTKQIVSCLNKIRKQYREFKTERDNGSEI
ncbi:MAG: hypothetical protein CL811_05740 [Colwelliaceae bacterium]|nr:hypothetical protein [Colwelliaceae bacterium]